MTNHPHSDNVFEDDQPQSQSKDASAADEPITASPAGLGDDNYESLAQFRKVLRDLAQLNEPSDLADGLTSQRYEALLALRARGLSPKMTVGELAEELSLKPHSVAGLVNRMEEVGFVRRIKDRSDRRRVLIALTEDGARRLAECAANQIAELEKQSRILGRLSSFFRGA
jgi:DNA-binding MarR family transcriptional regulator